MTLTSPIVKFAGRIVIVGFGSIGQGILPLLLRHIDMKPEQISIVTAEDRGRAEAEEYGIKFHRVALTRENFRSVLDPMVGEGDFILNLSVDVSSLALIKFCHTRGALYLDTCIEPWAGGYTDTSLSPSLRSWMVTTQSAPKKTLTCSSQISPPLASGAGAGVGPTCLPTAITFRFCTFTRSLPMRPPMRIPLNTREGQEQAPIEPG